MKSTEQTTKDRSQAQEIEALKGELELARRQLREFKLWQPLREVALKMRAGQVSLGRSTTGTDKPEAF